MKTLHQIIAGLLLGAVSISQLPTPANCQMALRGIFSMTCSMPCCKKAIPTSQCPMVKEEEPRDTISKSPIVFESSLQRLYTLKEAIASPMVSASQTLEVVRHVIRRILIGPAQAVRAPPAFIHLINA